MNFQMFKPDLEKEEEPEIKFPTPVGSKKQENSRKPSISASLFMPEPLTVQITATVKNSSRREDIRPSYLSPEKPICGVKKQPLEPYMEQLTGSKLGKKYDKTVYCHHVYLTYMQSTSCKMPGWMKLKLQSRLLGEISTISHTEKVTF